jgi:hypothetical protein
MKLETPAQPISRLTARLETNVILYATVAVVTHNIYTMASEECVPLESSLATSSAKPHLTTVASFTSWQPSPTHLPGYLLAASGVTYVETPVRRFACVFESTVKRLASLAAVPYSNNTSENRLIIPHGASWYIITTSFKEIPAGVDLPIIPAPNYSTLIPASVYVAMCGTFMAAP